MTPSYGDKSEGEYRVLHNVDNILTQHDFQKCSNNVPNECSKHVENVILNANMLTKSDPKPCPKNALKDTNKCFKHVEIGPKHVNLLSPTCFQNKFTGLLFND